MIRLHVPVGFVLAFEIFPVQRSSLTGCFAVDPPLFRFRSLSMLSAEFSQILSPLQVVADYSSRSQGRTFWSAQIILDFVDDFKIFFTCGRLVPFKANSDVWCHFLWAKNSFCCINCSFGRFFQTSHFFNSKHSQFGVLFQIIVFESAFHSSKYFSFFSKGCCGTVAKIKTFWGKLDRYKIVTELKILRARNATRRCRDENTFNHSSMDCSTWRLMHSSDL